MGRSALWQTVSLLCCVAAASASTKDPQFAADSASFEHDIATYSAIDASYPPAMRARLDFASYLTKHLDADCGPRLDLAEKLRAQVEANPAAVIVLPDAAAYLMQLRYAIAAHRASCTSDKAQALKWRQESRLAAEQAIPLYAANYDYPDMAFMQFNLAYQDRELGNGDKALAELQAAIDMDSRYGLREDAEENVRILAEWQGRTVTDLQLAELMNTYAGQTATLKFAWTPVAGHWSETMDIAHVRDGKVLRSSLHSSGRNDISERDADLIVEMHVDDVHVSANGPAKESDADVKRATVLARIFGNLPPVRVSRQGEFKSLENADEFTAHAMAQLAELHSDIPTGDGAHQKEMQANLDTVLAASLSGEAITQDAGQGFLLEAGLWANTTLTQNRWLQGEGSLALNGAPPAFVKHALNYAFTGWVPCAADSTERRCAELLIKANPDDNAVQGIHDALLKQGKGELSYWSTTVVRVVVDPSTLRLYTRDTRRYAYLALGTGSKREADITVSLDVTTATYPP